MNKDRVELFLAALESGKYTQCTGELRKVNLYDQQRPWRHCALGVATDVALNNGLREQLAASYGADMSDIVFYDSVMYKDVADWYGFEDVDPDLGLNGNGAMETISGFNDMNTDFWTIAQMGREQWLKDQG